MQYRYTDGNVKRKRLWMMTAEERRNLWSDVDSCSDLASRWIAPDETREVHGYTIPGMVYAGSGGMCHLLGPVVH